MKVLEVSFIPPDNMSGGGRGILQSIKSIIANMEMDYVGPAFNLKLLNGTKGSNNLKNVFTLYPNKYRVKSAINFMIHGATTSFFEAWVEKSLQLNWAEYDYVHIESSRYDFVVKDAKKHNKKVFIRLHNIERDYGMNALQRKWSIGNIIRYKSFEINEKRCVRKADKLIFITQQDVTRAEHLYGGIADKSMINPVCMSLNNVDITNYIRKESKRYTFLITGSLSFGPNLDGIIWFIENVWDKISEDIHAGVELIVAGSKPADELKVLISKNDTISLIDTPKDMTPYLLKADAYIAPIFDGAGMKVKVAEALSFGLPVIGTDHAWIGYETIQYGRYVANTAEHFVYEMKVLIRTKTDANRRKTIQDNFGREYSMSSSIRRYKELLKKMELTK